MERAEKKKERRRKRKKNRKERHRERETTLVSGGGGAWQRRVQGARASRTSICSIFPGKDGEVFKGSFPDLPILTPRTENLTFLY